MATASGEKVTFFVSHCPLGEICGKNWSRLGKHTSLEEAKARVKHHLMNSSKHIGIPEGEADSLADQVEYEMEEWEATAETPTEAKGSGKKGQGQEQRRGGSGSGKGWRGGWDHDNRSGSDNWSGPDNWKGHANWSGADNRSSPYGQSSARGSQDIAVPTRMLQPIPEFGDCIEALTRSEASARTAARVARSAALAFEDEASILHSTLLKLQTFVASMGRY